MGWSGFDGDFVLRRYEYELERREKLSAAVQPPIVVISALVAAEIAMLRSWYPGGGGMGALFPFVLGLCLFAIAVFCCFYHLTKSYVDQGSQRIGGLSEWASKRQEYLQPAADEEQRQRRSDLFDAGLRGQIAKAADVNTQRNDARSEALFELRRSLVWLLIATVFTSVPYAANQVGAYFNGGIGR